MVELLYNVYLQVVNETLRVANIIGGIFRRTISDVHVNGT